MRREIRIWSPHEKANFVLEILREVSTVTEISKKHEIAQPVLSRWKADFIANMSSASDKKGVYIEKIKKECIDKKDFLIKKIGELSLNEEYQKKDDKLS